MTANYNIHSEENKEACCHSSGWLRAGCIPPIDACAKYQLVGYTLGIIETVLQGEKKFDMDSVFHACATVPPLCTTMMSL